MSDQFCPKFSEPQCIYWWYFSRGCLGSREMRSKYPFERKLWCAWEYFKNCRKATLFIKTDFKEVLEVELSGAPNRPKWGSAEPNLYRTDRNEIRPEPNLCRTGQNPIRPKPNIRQIFSKVRPNIRPNHKLLIMQPRNTFSKEFSVQYYIISIVLF